MKSNCILWYKKNCICTFDNLYNKF